MICESLFGWGYLTDEEEEALLTPTGAGENKDKMKKGNSTPPPGITSPRPLLLDTSFSGDGKNEGDSAVYGR